MSAAEQVASELFVGREQELTQFKQMLNPAAAVHILNVHTHGDGGIGKTQLLLRMQRYCQTIPNEVVFARELIDFYHTESRSRYGVLRQIADNLGAPHFPEFGKQAQRYRETADISELEGLLVKLEAAFRQDYAAFAAAVRQQQRVIVLFFDTYEFIQRVETTHLSPSLPTSPPLSPSPMGEGDGGEVRGSEGGAGVGSSAEGLEPPLPSWERVGARETTAAAATNFSHWIETQLFPALRENTRLIVSGRFPLTDVDCQTLTVAKCNLAHFDAQNTRAFWKKCFQIETDAELIAKIGSDALIDAFHALADGRPVLLALFADWINYGRNPRSPRKLLAEIEERTGTPLQGGAGVGIPLLGEPALSLSNGAGVGSSLKEEKLPLPSWERVGVRDSYPVIRAQKDLFEKALIERFASDFQPENCAAPYLAVAYRRMTPAILHALTDIPLAEARQILLEKLRPLSFVKYKEIEVVILHDEMRRLLNQHWWQAQDAARDDRREIARDLVNYYDEQLLADQTLVEIDRETYTSELIEYAFLADPRNGLNRFCQEFDFALDDGRFDYCDLLLREAEQYRQENPADLPFPDELHIRLRRIRYYTATDRDYAGALRMAAETLHAYRQRPDWKNSDIYGHFLLVHGNAAFFLEQFADAMQSYLDAKAAFYNVGADYWLHWVNNLIGYAYYRQGQFQEAKTYLLQSREGFYRLLVEQSRLTARERRQLLQGFQYALGNLAIVYYYTGQVERAVRNAEITLSIVRLLPHNNLEIARARATAGRIFALAGDMINARHHLSEAERIMRDIRNRIIIGRIKPDLAALQYRVNQFAYFLEYYRATEMERIITKYVPVDEAQQASTLVQEAIRILSEPPAIKKELADAYYALGELTMVTPVAEHWEQAESALLKSLAWGQASKFAYRVADTLESLVTLYYFWNGSATDIAEAVKAQNQAKFRQYQAALETAAEFNAQTYPDIFSKYRTTLGDIEFDRAIAFLEAGEGLDAAFRALQTAFTHYIAAANLVQNFSRNLHYLTLRVFYNRLKTLVHLYRAMPDVMARLRALPALWQGQTEEFDRLSHYVLLSVNPTGHPQKLDELQQHFQRLLQQGNFELAALLNSCLLDIYTALIASANGTCPEPAERRDEYWAKRILQLNVQFGLHRVLGDEYQAIRCIRSCRKELAEITDVQLRLALEGVTDGSEGTLEYRRGEYGRLLELYLRDDLHVARERFDHQFPGARERARQLLLSGERKLQQALAFWEKQLTEKSVESEQDLRKTQRPSTSSGRTGDTFTSQRKDTFTSQLPVRGEPVEPLCAGFDEKDRLQALIKQYLKSLGEVEFRLGELLMINEQFDDVAAQAGAFSYLKQALRHTQQGGDAYRYDNAVQSYLNALYFAGKQADSAYVAEWRKYEQYLEDKLRVPAQPIFPAIMSRLRIMQGDVLFLQYFRLKELPAPIRETLYCRRGQPNVPILRTMLRYYVEACNFMAPHSAVNFAAAVRVLQRRIRLIADREALEVIQKGLHDIWQGQPYLTRRKNEELETLFQFAKIRSLMIADEERQTMSQ